MISMQWMMGRFHFLVCTISPQLSTRLPVTYEYVFFSTCLAFLAQSVMTDRIQTVPLNGQNARPTLFLPRCFYWLLYLDILCSLSNTQSHSGIISRLQAPHEMQDDSLRHMSDHVTEIEDAIPQSEKECFPHVNQT